jgi:hypothetical protein
MYLNRILHIDLCIIWNKIFSCDIKYETNKNPISACIGVNVRISNERPFFLLVQSGKVEIAWWRLFQKRVVRPKCDIYVFIGKKQWNYINHLINQGWKGRYYLWNCVIRDDIKDLTLHCKINNGLRFTQFLLFRFEPTKKMVSRYLYVH